MLHDGIQWTKQMQKYFREWTFQRIVDGDLSTSALVRIFATRVTIGATVAAIGLDCIAVTILQFLDFLPGPWLQAHCTGAVMTVFVASPLTYFLARTFGSAVKVLTEDRDTFIRLSEMDPLSGLANRRVFDKKIEHDYVDATLAIFDIDHFKSINDTFGHAVGDQVIRMVANELTSSLGGDAFVARIGGEEFAVILQGGTPEERQKVLCDSRHAVSTGYFVEGRSLSITLSAGVATLGLRRTNGEALRLADRMLYAAKNNGRNQAVCLGDKTLAA